MTCISRGFCVLAGLLGVMATAGGAQAAVLSVKAVKINGTPITPTSVVSADPGDRIEAEVFLSGWDADSPGAGLTVFQFTIDGNSHFIKTINKENVTIALPGCFDLGTVVPCTEVADCPAVYDQCEVICETTCAFDSQSTEDDEFCAGLSADRPVCSNRNLCFGPQHEPEACTFADDARSDWVFTGNPAVSACSFANGLNIVCGSTTFNPLGTPDDGSVFYVGTLTIDLLDNACGEIPVTFLEGIGTTFLLLSSGIGEVQPQVENLTINVSAPCPGVCPRIISSVPENCAVDARAPSALNAANPALWFNANHDFELTFNAAPDGGFAQNQFSRSTEPPQAILPSIDDFSVDGNTVTISFNRPPSLFGAGGATTGRWMCIDFNDPTPGCPGDRICWGRLPGDVNGDNMVTQDDLTALIVGLNLGGLTDLHCDMDHSGGCFASDLVMWIDMANGAEALNPAALGLDIPTCPTAP